MILRKIKLSPHLPFKTAQQFLYPIIMTDIERAPERAKKLTEIPRGCIVIFRDYLLENREDEAKKIARICRQKGHILLISGSAKIARSIGANGIHLPSYLLRKRVLPGSPIVSAAIHNQADLFRAKSRKIPLLLLSPIFKTRSHPTSRTLGIHRFARLAGQSKPIALGGVNQKTARKLKGLKVNGIAAIDGWF